MPKKINKDLAKLKKGDFFKFLGKKTVYVFSHRQSNFLHYYKYWDVNDWGQVSKFSTRQIDPDFEF